MILYEIETPYAVYSIDCPEDFPIERAVDLLLTAVEIATVRIILEGES